jgi:hypothetical protein
MAVSELPGIHEGMVLTIGALVSRVALHLSFAEPGYYDVKAGFGIRIENVYIVRAANARHTQAETGTKFLCFEYATLVPIQTTLIELSLLTFDEVRARVSTLRVNVWLFTGELAESLSRARRATHWQGAHRSEKASGVDQLAEGTVCTVGRVESSPSLTRQKSALKFRRFT